jgi:hypothetical protein
MDRLAVSTFLESGVSIHKAEPGDAPSRDTHLGVSQYVARNSVS